MSRNCAECGSDAEDLDIVCSTCGALIYVDDITQVRPAHDAVEYIPPDRTHEIDSPAVKGAAILGAIFPNSRMAQLIGAAMGTYIASELKAGTKLVEVGVEKKRKFPTAIPKSKKKRKSKNKS